jgi:hypothetical protein
VPTYRKNAISAFRSDEQVNDEKFYFKHGSPVFHATAGRLGVLICYDRWFPEAWRVLALRGAELVCVPNASLGDVSDLLVPTMRACAAQNLVYVVVTNRAGVEVALLQPPEARAAGRGPGDHPLRRPDPPARLLGPPRRDQPGRHLPRGGHLAGGRAGDLVRHRRARARQRLREYPGSKLLVDCTLRSDLSEQQRPSFEEARTRGTEAIDLRATSRTAPFH